MSSASPLEIARKRQMPRCPPILQNPNRVQVAHLQTQSDTIEPEISAHFGLTSSPKSVQFTSSEITSAQHPLRVGALFSGGQAPGGHNILSGLYHTLFKMHGDSALFGFLNGPAGLLAKEYCQVGRDKIDDYINTGGFDMLGSGRLKIETPAQFASALATCNALQLDGLVIIGGDDSNTNAALLAKYFRENGCSTTVVGVPKTIDGDLKGGLCEISFGHDTACKLYSELVGNVARDAKSAGKYYHFIRLMGRSASHITLECALQTEPTYTLIGEEVLEKSATLTQIVQDFSQIVQQRAHVGKSHGVFLIPEGLIEFIPEMRVLIGELNDLLGKGSDAAQSAIQSKLSIASAQLFRALPATIQQQLLLDRDPHGNVQVSRIETERLLAELVHENLQKSQFQGTFSAVTHFFGYEARASLPTHFDSDYTFSLGGTAGLLINHDLSGYMATVSKLTKEVDHWQCGGLPLISLMAMEKRQGQKKPVIGKALVDTSGLPFERYRRLRERDITQDYFRFPGPIQLFGPQEICQAHTLSLALENT